MASRKRNHEEVEEVSAKSHSDERNLKQQKTVRAAQAAAESNSDSSYVSAAAAIFSDSEGDSNASQSSLEESDSELSTSSEEPSSESEEDEDSEDDNEANDMQDDEQEIINVRPGGKPRMTKEGTDSSLLRRLKNFLPEMKEADMELEREREAGTLGDRNMEASDEEGGPHIEMNLGLGVLEEKGDDEDDDMSDEEDSQGEEDVMRRLMGEKQKPVREMKIQEVGEG